MKKKTITILQKYAASTAVILGALIFTLALETQIKAQSAATKRLDVAVNGFELNEAAAKDALEAGADINWQNPAMSGETMLITAIKGFKEPKIIKFLLDNGADASLKDDSGKTALQWARQYNIGRDRNGREIIAMLEAAAAGGGGQTTETKKADAAETKPANKTAAAPGKTENNSAAAKKPQRRTGGAPDDEEIKETIEKKFTNDYIRHFFGVDNKVTFEWTGGITVGAIQTVRSAPEPCYPVKLQVSVTAEDPRDGNRSTVVRGLNATTGNYREEIFCFYKDGFGEWAFGVYGK